MSKLIIVKWLELQSRPTWLELQLYIDLHGELWYTVSAYQNMYSYQIHENWFSNVYLLICMESDRSLINEMLKATCRI